MQETNEELQFGVNLRQDTIEDLEENQLANARTIQALQQQINKERTDYQEQYMNNVAVRDAAVEDIKKHNVQLMVMNENFKEDIERQNTNIQELNDRVSELEQIKIQGERLISQLKGKLEDALQA